MLKPNEREVIVEFLFNSETAFLVENMMLWIPEDILKNLARNLLDKMEEEQDA
jgi:hypothetical protein